MNPNPYAMYKNYKAASTVSMTPLEILIALYDKCVVECAKGAEYMDRGQYIKASESIRKVERIVDELRFALDMKYEIAHNLRDLYAYYRTTLIDATRNKDSASVRYLIHHFQTLKETFQKVGAMV
ncbi:MAG: flagellar protein FliS [Ruminococcus sp.]|jgi:flagellar protein FliS|nr:flagellar protein FliS [Ruminococcus sp.]